MRLRVFALLFSLAIGTDVAAAYCSKPDAPSCAEGYGRFDDQSDFDSCKSEMENYKDEVEEFIDCVRRQADEARDEHNDAVQSFNARARG